MGLKIAIELEVRNLNVFRDSEIVVRQVRNTIFWARIEHKEETEAQAQEEKQTHDKTKACKGRKGSTE